MMLLLQNREMQNILGYDPLNQFVLLKNICGAAMQKDKDNLWHQ